VRARSSSLLRRKQRERLAVSVDPRAVGEDPDLGDVRAPILGIHEDTLGVVEGLPETASVSGSSILLLEAPGTVKDGGRG
jgi:hypothetical protein